MVKKQNLGQNDQILASTEFSRHTHYDFLKVDHKNNFYIKKTMNIYCGVLKLLV